MESTDALQQQQTLAALLQKRIDLIGDHAFRDRDAEGHLAALREVSEALDANFQTLKPQLPPRLRHFMEQASYSKALEYLKQGSGAA
jgi:hypothetical protein